MSARKDGPDPEGWTEVPDILSLTARTELRSYLFSFPGLALVFIDVTITRFVPDVKKPVV